MESKKFRQIDIAWRQIMGRLHNHPHALSGLSQEGLVDKWKLVNEDLEVVQKGLDEYLQTKRDAFARFYFLSNDEILEILSETKNPGRIQPYLPKVFENVKRVAFSNTQITTLISSEQEEIPLVKEVITKGRNVEYWMGSLETEMVNAVKQALFQAVEEYSEYDQRTDWVVEHPGQCIVTGAQVHWTAECEHAIETGGVSAYYEKLGTQLVQLVVFVRKNVTKLQRITIGALIVIDVHAKDIVKSLIDEKVPFIEAFLWNNLLFQGGFLDRSKDLRCTLLRPLDFPAGLPVRREILLWNPLKRFSIRGSC